MKKLEINNKIEFWGSKLISLNSDGNFGERVCGDITINSEDINVIENWNSDNIIKLWDASTGKQLATMRGHESIIMYAVLSRDKKHIVSASLDGTARLWDANTGKQLAIMEGHEHGPIYADFSSDGQYIVTGSGHISKSGGTLKSEDTARIWDKSGKQIAIMRGHEAGVQHAAFSPDRHYLLT